MLTYLTMARTSDRVSIVLPAFAEEQTITDLVERMHVLLKDDLEEVLIVLSPKSPAKTVEICQAASRAHPATVKVSVQKQTPGVGFAYREGIALARGALAVLIDSDGEMDVEDIPAMLAKQRSTGADLVVGSRWAKGGGAEGYERLKYVLNRGYQFIFRSLYWTRIHDLTFGYKLGKTEILKSLPLMSQFQEIGCEVTLRTLRAGFKVEEIPTTWRKRKEGVSTNPLGRNMRYAYLALSIWRG